VMCCAHMRIKLDLGCSGVGRCMLQRIMDIMCITAGGEALRVLCTPDVW
jgi:hypothetical protein